MNNVCFKNDNNNKKIIIIIQNSIFRSNYFFNGIININNNDPYTLINITIKNSKFENYNVYGFYW